MARPKKDNADYFSHDNDMRNDPKVKALRKKFKHEGYSIYNMMLELLCRESNFKVELSELNVELISGDFDCEPSQLRCILNYCSTVNLFVIIDNVIYSNGLVKRLQPVVDKRIKAKERFLLQKQDEQSHTVTETPQSIVNNSKVNQTINNNEVIKPDAAPASPVLTKKVTIEEKQEACKKRQLEFYNELTGFVNIYSKDLLRAFYDYWSEANKAGTKFLKEYETTWDLKKRLERWYRNDKKFNKKGVKADTSIQEKADEYTRGLEEQRKKLMADELS